MHSLGDAGVSAFLRLLFFFFFAFLISSPSLITSKSTIEPCSNADSCSAFVGYTLYTELKVSEVAALFNVDPVSLLTANSVDISYPDVENYIFPSSLFVKVPIKCFCVDGIRKSTSTTYKTRPCDTLFFIADEVYGGLVSADQIKEANSKVINDPSVINVGTSLMIPLPCTCFNGTDNNLPATYMSYVVRPIDTLVGIARKYSTTVTDLMNVNALGGPSIKDGDILAISLSACPSNFPKYASDYALSVPNGSYAITATHCVQCSCGPGTKNLYCMPASLAVSCSSMQCSNSNLMIGNVTFQQTSAGCNVTTCSYGGFVNGSIVAVLSSSLQPRCPGPQQFPPILEPYALVSTESIFASAPSPSEIAGAPTIPGFVPSSGLPMQTPPANGPAGSASSAYSLAHPLATFPMISLLTFSLRNAISFML